MERGLPAGESDPDMGEPVSKEKPNTKWESSQRIEDEGFEQTP